MAKSACDRCNTVADLEAAGPGMDLCMACRHHLQIWMSNPPSKKRARRVPNGLPWQIVQSVIAEHGYITPEMYRAKTGQGGRTAEYALYAMAKRGVLDHERYYLETRFFLPQK